MPFDEIFYGVTIAAIALVDVVVAAHILLHKRDEPERASLWLLTVVSFPVFGVVLYLFAGVNRRETLGFKIEEAGDRFEATLNNPAVKTMSRHLSEIAPFVSREFEAGEKTTSYKVALDRFLPDTCPLSGNRVELLCDGRMAYPVMLEAISAAKSSIHLESFIIANDQVGAMIFDALERKAAEGVKVKAVYDRFGSLPAIASHFFNRYMKRGGNFEIVPFSHANLLAPWRVQLRNHRKLLIVDGETAFIGGINISADNVSEFAKRSRYIHDLHCMIRGPAVGQLQTSFLRDWCYAARRRPAGVFLDSYFPSPKSCGDNVARVVPSGHGHVFEGSERVFFTAASTARKFIWIMTPYFVPDKPFVKAIRMAAVRGVDVRLIVPLQNNHWYVKMATRSLYEPLLSDGVRIFERNGSFSHAKAMLVDGDWAFVGSSNCDIRSFRLNYELDIVVSSGSFLQSLRTQLSEELEDSREISLEEVEARSVPERLAESACALLTPVL